MASHIDHIDRNRLNCQRNNLRPATNSQNLANRGKNRNNTSGYKGVTWDKERRKWLAQIEVRGRNRCLGRYDDKEEAHVAYCVALRKHFAEYAYAG
jgi:gluconate kinase